MNKNRTVSRAFACASVIFAMTLSQNVFAKDAPTKVSPAKEFQIDNTHSSVGFEISHFFTKVKGQFRTFEGEFSFDSKNLKDSQVNMTIHPDSIQILGPEEPKRDAHLKGEEFFDVAKYPTAKFVSTEVKEVKGSGNKKFKVIGNFTMKGITKPLTLDAEFLGDLNDPWGNHRASFSATGKISRKDYNMSWNKTLDNGKFVLGDEVALALNIEAIEKKQKDDKK